MYDNVQVLYHSSIRIAGERILYFDPFHIEGEPHDGDIVFVTHEHFDHFSPEDIKKVAKDGTALILPAGMAGQEKEAGLNRAEFLKPGDRTEVLGVSVEAVAAYNIGREFHVRDKNWLGYVVTMGGTRYYVAGDTDANEENRQVACDVAVVPVGGKFTMDAKEAAAFVNGIKPKCAIPSHYGSVVGTEEDAEIFCRAVDDGIQTRK